jgi:hypothetical protein
MRFFLLGFHTKVTAIEECRDVTSMWLDELMGSLQTYEMSLQVLTKFKKKRMALKAKEGFEDNKNSDEKIRLITR